MIEKGQRVRCVDRKDPHFGKEGVFSKYVANALWVTFDDGKESFYLANDLQKL